MSNFELFIRQIPYYWLRSIVRPGLTGWAQIRQGYANGLEEETEKMRYDLYYIKRMSAWLDMQILCSTVKTVLAVGEAAPARRSSKGPGWLRARYLASRIGLVPVLIALFSQSAGATRVSFEPADVMFDVVGRAGPHWLVPFHNDQPMPASGGQRRDGARELSRQIALGHETFLLDVPVSREELDHTNAAFAHALRR